MAADHATTCLLLCVICNFILNVSIANSVDPDQTAPVGAVCLIADISL